MLTGSRAMTERRHRSARRLGAVCFVSIPLLTLGACATKQEQVTQKEDSLAAAGFLVQAADTQERQAMLNKLPPHHFVQRVHGDVVTYVYADPLVCDCLYIGSQQAYAQYRQQKQQQHIADEQEMTAQMYSDPNWNWGAWGPGYGFDRGYGPGF